MKPEKLLLFFVISFSLFFSESSVAAVPAPVVDYRLDACYFLNGAGGGTGDVIDSSVNGLDGTSQGNVTIATGQLCSSALFNGNNSNTIAVADNALLNSFTKMTVSVWVYPTAYQNWGTIVMKTTSDSWGDGWGFAAYSGQGNTVRFFVDGYQKSTNAVTVPVNQWTHLTGVYTGSRAKIFVNGVRKNTKTLTFSNSTSSLFLGNEITGSTSDEWDGRIDEVKIWGRALTNAQVLELYNNELAGNNYDSSSRTCSQCGAKAAAGSWSLVGIPADTRNGSVTVNDIFNSMSGTFNTDWRVYKRSYSGTDNSSSYTQMALADVLNFGQGYWLGTKVDQAWNTDGQPVVNYDSNHSACTANRCVEIDLTSVTKNFGPPDNDPNDGSGPYRYNMSGFIGTVPVDWAKCRFLVDGVAYTPSAAQTAGYANKQIWQYNPGSGGANANGYTTCDDTGIGACKLLPYEGFWIELQGPTKGKVVKLLIPQE